MITAHEARGLVRAQELIAEMARKAKEDEAARAKEIERERWRTEVLPTVMVKIDERIREVSNKRESQTTVILGDYDQGQYLSDEATRQLELLGYKVSHEEKYQPGSPGGYDFSTMEHSITISWPPITPTA